MMQGQTLKTMFRWLYLAACATVGAAFSVDPSSVISVQRGVAQINPGFLGCDFVGTITLGGPFSLSEEDKFYNIGNKQLTSFQLMVDYINRHRCGVEIQGERYSLVLESFDDQSSKEWTTAIANHLVERPEVDIWLGGYSSGLTSNLADVANVSGKLLLAPGAASTGVFKDRPQAFGSFPPTAKYTAQAVKALALAGAKSISTVYEDASFTRGVCAAIPELAAEYGLEVTSTQQVESTPNVTLLEGVVENLTDEDPDVVMTCTYDGGCVNWMQAMQNLNWSPKAQIFTVCVGLQKFVDAVGPDAEYIMGVTPWDQSLNIIDEVTGWSARDFAERFMEATGDVDVTYHAASASSVISIAVQAIERTNSLDEALLTQEITQSTFQTAYGSMSFDVNGQSQAPSLLIQYDGNGTVQTVFPEETSSGPVLYPMPTWDQRACQRDSRCVMNGNSCSKEGICECTNPEEYAAGAGAGAQCLPKEEFNFIMKPLRSFVYCLVALSLTFGLVALGWTYYYRNNLLVKVSQPVCLGLIVLGSMVSTLSIIPMSYETGYRDSPDINRADFACMAVPWLWGLGFTITFSSLFAKVWRVKTLFKAASGFRRQKVGYRSILWIMGGMLSINAAILTIFQIVSPHRWERVVIDDIDGFAIESEGSCDSESGWWFWLALVGFNIISLFYTLILCFQTKEIPSEFAESSHIFLAVMFMFQVLVLAIPVSAMVRDDPDVFYFIRAAAVFLQNFTVLIIIFGPKMYRIYQGEDTATAVRKSLRSGVVSGNSQTGLNRESSGNLPMPARGYDSVKSLSGHFDSEVGMDSSDKPTSLINLRVKDLPDKEKKSVSFCENPMSPRNSGNGSTEMSSEFMIAEFQGASSSDESESNNVPCNADGVDMTGSLRSNSKDKVLTC